MSEQEKTSSTKATKRKPRQRGTRTPFNHANSVTMAKAKKSNIPLSTETNDTKNNLIDWGGSNSYPYFLNYLAKNNAMHSGILRAKRYFTVSGGLRYEGADTEKWEKFFENGKKSYNDKDLNGVMWDASLNFEKSNMFIFKVKLSALNDGEVRNIEEIPFEKVRFQIKEDKDKNVSLTGSILVSDDWLESKPVIQQLDEYNPNQGNKEGEEKQRMFYVLYKEESGQSLDNPKGKVINQGIYPDPPYGGSITAIDTGIQILKYNNSEIYNGFSLGTVLNFNNGVPKNKEAKDEVAKEVMQSGTGAYNANGTMITFSNGKERAPSVLSLSGNNLADRYDNALDNTIQSILQGHSVTTPILFGIKTEGSLGNATELETGYLIMQSNYFKARRNALLSVINWIGKEVEGLKGEIFFEEPIINFDSNVAEEGNEVADAINKMSPLVATNLLKQMTPNEIRALGKLPPIVGGDELPSKEVSTFSKEDNDKILERLKKHGTSKDKRNPLFVSSYIEGAEEDLLKAFAKEAFQTLSDNQMQTLNLINEGQDQNSIRKALDVSGKDIALIYKSLESAEMITDKGVLTEQGATQLASIDIDKLEILYEYRERPDAPALLPGGESRDFCKTLLGLNRLYSREDINLISGMEGYNVFDYRGGWYHNPDTDKNNPGCRHEWAQVVTFINN